MKKYLTLLALVILYSCSKSGSKPALPTVTTAAVTNVTDSTATAGGTVTNSGNAQDSCGVRYDTSASFKTATQVFTTPGAGTFSLTIGNLPGGTTFFVQAFAKNSAGTAFGSTVQFTTGTPPSDYTVSTYAGSGVNTFANGPALQAGFVNPVAVAVDPMGIVYVTEVLNTANSGRIRRIATDGTVSTLATLGEGGSELLLDPAGNIYDLDISKTLYKLSPAGVAIAFAGNGVPTSTAVDGQGTAAGFANPISMDIDANGNIFVSDEHSIRKVTPSGYVSTLPTKPATGFSGIAVDQSDNIFVSDGANIEKTDTLGNITIIAGSAQGLSSFIPELRLDHNGNLVVSDAGHYRILLITPAGVVTTIAGAGFKGVKNGPGSVAWFTEITGLTIDASNNIFAADAGAYNIRKITHN